MPGYANWKTLYKEEYQQLFEEGYPVGANPKPDMTEVYLPFPADVRGTLKEDALSEPEWEQAYQNLWRVREQGIRPDFPFAEPEAFNAILAAGEPLPELVPLNQQDYEERIKGAWYGRCGAVILGKPLEMGFNRLKIKEYLESVDAYPLDDWVPARSEKLDITLREDCIHSSRGNVRFVQPDDDIHYTILALLLAEKKGLNFNVLDVGMNWLDNIPYHWFWCSSRQAYHHLVNMTDDRARIVQAGEIPLKLNPWRECIDGQLRGDLWGYVNPGNPVEAARLAFQECSSSLVKNGIYGGMFVAGCIAAALSTVPSIDVILQGGLSVIPNRSRLANAVNQVIGWYREEQNWIPVCDKIYGAYGHLPFAGTMNNIAMVVLALLHGNLDFGKTITTAVMSGIDTDCNSATAGSIVGAAIGYGNLDKKWIDPLNDTVKTVVAEFGEGRISDLVKRTIQVNSVLKI